VSAAGAGADPAKDLPGSITTVHRYDLPLPRQDVWTLISEVSQYRRWWQWLRAFEARGLVVGDEWRCEVQPPVPYAVRFRVAIEQIEAPVVVRARVSGDVMGEAVLVLRDGNGGCSATLESSLAPGATALRLVSRFAGPVARFGHDWVLDSGARQFIARAVGPLVGDETA
jgi:uncharacterized protein YndB with AHSA1/START domain